MRTKKPAKTNPRGDPLIAIREYCLQCSGGSRKMVQNCVMPYCPLYQFRSVEPLEQSRRGK